MKHLFWKEISKVVMNFVQITWFHVYTHYYRKLNTIGSRTPITNGFGPRWCMLVVINDLYLCRFRAGGDGILPPSVWRTIRW